MHIIYNDVYTSVIQVTEMHTYFCPTSFIKKIEDVGGIPFVIYQDNDKDIDNTCRRIAGDIRMMSLVTGSLPSEVEKMDFSGRIKLYKEHIHKAVYGFILKSGSKKGLISQYEHIKKELEEDGMNIWNMGAGYKIIMELESDNIINRKPDSNKYRVFRYFNYPKYATNQLVKEINSTKSSGVMSSEK